MIFWLPEFDVMSCFLMFWQLKGFEIIKAVHLDPVPFDMERDLLTPTYKKKRPQLLKYYQVSHLVFSLNLISSAFVALHTEVS